MAELGKSAAAAETQLGHSEPASYPWVTMAGPDKSASEAETQRGRLKPVCCPLAVATPWEHSGLTSSPAEAVKLWAVETGLERSALE